MRLHETDRCSLRDDPRRVELADSGPLWSPRRRHVIEFAQVVLSEALKALRLGDPFPIAVQDSAASCLQCQKERRDQD